MPTLRRHLCILCVFLIGLLLGTVTGCGAGVNDPAVLIPRFLSECEGDAGVDIEDINVVILDWTGGMSPIYPDDVFEGVDLSLFETDEGETLADNAEAFKEAVRRQITRIYCDLPELSVRVINGEDDEVDFDVTVVHLTQELPPKGGTDVGEAEYDPCNLQSDNAALLFGERLLTLGNGYAYDEWINVFANICAHEIGHTLGFAHVLRSEHPDTGRSLYIELMLDRHTMAELRREARFVFELTNCPDDYLQTGTVIH